VLSCRRVVGVVVLSCCRCCRVVVLSVLSCVVCSCLYRPYVCLGLKSTRVCRFVVLSVLTCCRVVGVVDVVDVVVLSRVALSLFIPSLCLCPGLKSAVFRRMQYEGLGVWVRVWGQD
jgi:hypothetical protein